MYEQGYKQRLVPATAVFEKHFGLGPLGKYFWIDNIKRDPETGCFYVYEPAFQPGDRAGWRCIGSTFEDAVNCVALSKRNN